MSAIISECGRYRYVLRRKIPSIVRWVRPILFVMLNPSTADAELDDPTIRRCKAFAERDGFTQLTVVNLFALRATDPAGLKIDHDPIGPENDRYLQEEILAHGSTGLVVAAWGAHPFATERAKHVLRMGVFDCLGKTKAGFPRHPLYIRSDQPFVTMEAP